MIRDRGSVDYCVPGDAAELFDSVQRTDGSSEYVKEAHGSGNLDELLTSVAREACVLLNVKRGVVCVRDARTGLYRGCVSAPACEAIKQYVADVSAGGFIREIVTTRGLVTIHDTGSDPRADRSLARKWRVRSALGVPMIVNDEVIGLLFLDNGEVPHEFDAGQQELATTFANLAAAAIAASQSAATLRESVASVQRENTMLRQANRVEERLAMVAAGGFSVESIAQTIADMTNKPCAIHDVRGVRVAAGRCRLDPARVPVQVDVHFRNRPQVARHLAGASATGPTIIGPIPAVGMFHRHMLVPLLAHDELWGHLVVMEVGARFVPLDSLVARRGAMMAAAKMAAQRATPGGGQRVNGVDRPQQRSHHALDRAMSVPEFSDLNLSTPLGPYVVVAISTAGAQPISDLSALNRACHAAGLGPAAPYEADGSHLVVLVCRAVSYDH